MVLRGDRVGESVVAGIILNEKRLSGFAGPFCFCAILCWEDGLVEIAHSRNGVPIRLTDERWV